MVSLSHAELKTAYIMDLNTANQLAENVMQTCQKASKPAAVTVLDQGGNVLASQRHESVGIHNLTASQRKAFTAYSTKTSTLDFMRHAQKNPDAQNLNTLDELLLLGGGVKTSSLALLVLQALVALNRIISVPYKAFNIL
ncbi:hypothetical protein F897_02572 [Acinetobacter variabilis]|uniref:Heme-binding protein n=1 Tax=Acinetobacter variabilis TaxID=70346 RepID=N9MHU9_9GAMM|nr:hypothetical protein F897_02572 [Acinetobacter variabilis]